MRFERIVILLNGEPADPAAVKRLVRSGAVLVCADGGARHAAAMGLEPRIVIGDMDSLPERLPRWLATVYVCDFDQERSDFEKALAFAAERGPKSVAVAGASGGRGDHALVNMALMETFSDRLDLEWLDARAQGRPAAARILRPGSHRLAARRGARVTLLPATAAARVTATGLRYPLRRLELKRASRGLSNEALGPVRLRLHSGRLWVVVSPA